MKRNLTILLQLIIVLLGVATLVFMLWMPHLEGRNVNATVFEVYFNDPFLAYAYLSSILYFVSLHQVFKVLGYVRENKVFTSGTVKALKTIKYCMSTLAVLIFGAMAYIFIFIRGTDDITGGIAMTFLLVVISSLVSVSANWLEKYINKNSMQIV